MCHKDWLTGLRKPLVTSLSLLPVLHTQPCLWPPHAHFGSTLCRASLSQLHSEALCKPMKDRGTGVSQVRVRQVHWEGLWAFSELCRDSEETCHCSKLAPAGSKHACIYSPASALEDKLPQRQPGNPLSTPGCVGLAQTTP